MNTLKNLIEAASVPSKPPLLAQPAAKTPQRQAPANWRREEPVLKFAPLAWLKLKLFLHADHVEIGGFGISAEDDLLYIKDFAIVKQTVTAVTVEFDDESVADHVDRCVDAGIALARCTRAWIHTHPGVSPQPSSVDEQTFSRIFGQNDWAMMIIVARDGASYVRLAFTAGPGGLVEIPLRVDWDHFAQDLLDQEDQLDALFSGWMDEYGKKIHHRPQSLISGFNLHKPVSERPSTSHAIWDPLDELYDQSLLEEDFASWADAMEEVYP